MGELHLIREYYVKHNNLVIFIICIWGQFLSSILPTYHIRISLGIIFVHHLSGCGIVDKIIITSLTIIGTPCPDN